MNTQDLVAYCLLFAAAAFDLCVMLRWDLQMLQQNSYFNSRYNHWLKTSGETTTVKRVLALAVLLGAVTTMAAQSWMVVTLLALVLLVQGVMLLRKKYKKPLVFTRRVSRNYFTSLAIVLLLVAFAAWKGHDTGGWPMAARAAALVTLVALAFSPLLTLMVNWLLKPVERHIAQGYTRDAMQRLAQMPNLKVVGITGSYGKTSTKHYLNRILSEHFSVLMTPGSFNTPMGVVRTIREMMQPYNEVFICEMGAKNVGDIREICDIVHPHYGIITAVGPQHLESFKTIENVQRTKFELADALPADGLVVLNNDFEYIANRQVDNVKAVRYAVTAGDAIDYWAEDVKYSSRGTSFTVVRGDQRLELTTRLVGECNISNLIAAVAIAQELGVPDEKIRYAVSRIEQVEHRLNMKRTAGGLVIIDDAYNSNPNGSRMALDVLASMNTGKRIVITPGMIELGDKQVYYNEQLGEHIAECCDVAIIVGQYNREAIVTGIERRRTDKLELHTVDTFAQAQQLMTSMAKAGDIVLYENDLPDTFK